MSIRSLTVDVYGALPDDYEETPESNRSLQLALRCLAPRERLAIELLYGLNGHPETPPKEAAAQLPNFGSRPMDTENYSIMGVKLQTLRVVQAKALRKLRHPANRWIDHCPWCHRNGTMNCRRSSWPIVNPD